MRRNLKAAIITLIAAGAGFLVLIFFAASAMSDTAERAVIASLIVAGISAGLSFVIGRFRWPVWFLVAVALALAAALIKLVTMIAQ